MTCSPENSVEGQSLERNLGCFHTMNFTTIQTIQLARKFVLIKYNGFFSGRSSGIPLQKIGKTTAVYNFFENMKERVDCCLWKAKQLSPKRMKRKRKMMGGQKGTIFPLTKLEPDFEFTIPSLSPMQNEHRK
jgi:transposase